MNEAPEIYEETQPTIQEQFLTFHEANPAVYLTLVRLARESVARGRKKGGIGNLWEVMRWELDVRVNHPEAPSLNHPEECACVKFPNNYRSRYSRLIMEREPDLVGFFHTCSLRSE
jgi:hypothetical protein